MEHKSADIFFWVFNLFMSLQVFIEKNKLIDQGNFTMDENCFGTAFLTLADVPPFRRGIGDSLEVVHCCSDIWAVQSEAIEMGVPDKEQLPSCRFLEVVDRGWG